MGIAIHKPTRKPNLVGRGPTCSCRAATATCNDDAMVVVAVVHFQELRHCHCTCALLPADHPDQLEGGYVHSGSRSDSWMESQSFISNYGSSYSKKTRYGAYGGSGKGVGKYLFCQSKTKHGGVLDFASAKEDPQTGS